MKPTHDDPGATDAPTTREPFATYAEDEAASLIDEPEPTLEGGTRHDRPGTDPELARPTGPVLEQGQGSDLGLQSTRPGDSETARGPGSTSRRGIVGRIEPGQTLYGKYLVLRKLGSGAMGEVWLVRHVMLKSEHALKVIVPNFATNGVALMRFQREFEVMASLRHEHAVTIYDATIDADGGYIDMEYVEGATLHEVLGKARGRAGVALSAPLMPLDWVVRVLDQLSEVLQVAHQKGVVHRDLKPSNLMLLGGRPPGKEYLKVLDFGIAKIRDDPEGVAGRDQEAAENKTQGFIGTPSYGSPEQAMGVDVDGRSDLYSVGIMLYEFVTGRLPFRGNHWQVMSQNASSPPPSFAEANPRLRPMPEVERVVLRMLAKDPNQRPQSARQLYGEFRQAVEAALPEAGRAMPSSAWDAHPSPFENLSTEHEGSVAEPPSTEAATLVGKAGAGSWKGKAAIDSPSNLGPSAMPAGGDRTGRTIAARLRPGPRAALILAVLIVGAASLLGLALLVHEARSAKPGQVPGIAGGGGNRPDSKAPIPGGTGRTTVTSLGSTDFERYWPEDYRPVEGYGQGMPWPEKVRRTTDQAVFVRFGEGVYLPETFEPDLKAGLAVDGWPKVLVKDDIRFLRMPGGTWNMGSWDDPNAVDRADGPLHPVALTGFYIQETEVTHGQFEAHLGRVDDSLPKDWEKTFNLLKRDVGPAVARRHPASNLSREKARAFARELGGQLPTEAQWEYAARSLGKQRRFVWGDGPAPDNNLARIDSIGATPAPVGSYPRDATEQGVLDLTGNVQEMCRDSWVSSYKKSDVAILDPCHPTPDPLKPEYAIRGAAYNSLARECTTTHRDKVGAADLFENLGFRLVVECPDSRKPR